MATVVHFGISDCARLRVLSARGFEVHDCGDSLVKLQESLQLHHPDAVLFTESDCRRSVMQACKMAYNLTPAPRILFGDTFASSLSRKFDAVVEPLTPPKDWLEIVEKTIEQTRAVVLRSAAARKQSRQLREESGEVRWESQERLARARKLQSEGRDR